MVVPTVGVGILLRQTRKYWYYVYQGVICKVKKDKVWSNIDKGKLQVSYGSPMKNRRKQKKSRTLDLHGIVHANVEEKVKAFLNFVDLPCKIITGKSTKMKAIVRNIVYDYGWSSREESSNNTGTLVIIEKKGENNE